MKKNELIMSDSGIYRILQIQDDKMLVIDCDKMNMPSWKKAGSMEVERTCGEEEVYALHDITLEDIDAVSPDRKQVMYQRYTMIAGVLPFLDDDKMRSVMITKAADEYGVSKQTLRSFLCRYLVFQNIQALLPKQREDEKELTQDEKNMRWSLNKFFYNQKKNSLKTAYTLMLKEKYCDGSGKLAETYPSFYQYRYFYRTRKLQNYYISRDGLTNYQRNNRPCTGNGVQEFAPAVGVGMVDATVCDIYLVNESGQLVGRPILTACIDAYSGLCCGYSLSWEGGVYSLRNMMLNVIADKVEHCRKFGISITEDDWVNTGMLGKIVSDQGTEYIGYTFSQLAELGVTIVNLPSYRPELKGSVEKFFDVIQDDFKPHLKGKGVIEPDYQERGSHDYRKDACLTLADFEKIIIRCIIHYNSRRIAENFPFTEEMLAAGVQPYANQIFKWGMRLSGANLIQITEEQLVLCLLPRTMGKFSRFGLTVNKLRYRHNGYTESYLAGGEVTVAYNPDDVSFVWLIEAGNYVRFELVDARYGGMELDAVVDIQKKQKMLVRAEEHSSLQADIELAAHIQAVAENASKSGNVNIKGIRGTRKKEELTTHIDYAKEAGLHE